MPGFITKFRGGDGDGDGGGGEVGDGDGGGELGDGAYVREDGTYGLGRGICANRVSVTTVASGTWLVGGIAHIADTKTARSIELPR